MLNFNYHYKLITKYHRIWKPKELSTVCRSMGMNRNVHASHVWKGVYKLAVNMQINIYNEYL